MCVAEDGACVYIINEILGTRNASGFLNNKVRGVQCKKGVKPLTKIPLLVTLKGCLSL